MMDEGSGVRYMVTSLKRCLKLNLREDFGERHKVKYSLKEESSNICITEDSSLSKEVCETVKIKESILPIPSLGRWLFSNKLSVML